MIQTFTPTPRDCPEITIGFTRSAERTAEEQRRYKEHVEKCKARDEELLERQIKWKSESRETFANGDRIVLEQFERPDRDRIMTVLEFRENTRTVVGEEDGLKTIWPIDNPGFRIRRLEGSEKQ